MTQIVMFSASGWSHGHIRSGDRHPAERPLLLGGGAPRAVPVGAGAPPRAGRRAGHGHPLTVAGAEVRAFPEPERLLRLTSLDGLSAERVARLRGVARAALDGLLDARRLRELGDEAGPASVLGIRGIGEFWAQGIYVRGCGIRDVFPGEPLAVAALGQLHGLGDRPSDAAIRELTESHRPFRMWVCLPLRGPARRRPNAGLAR